MLHVIGLPHTQVNKKFGICAYTQKLVKFMQMFPDATLYANEGSDGRYVKILSHKDQDRLFGKYDWWATGEVYKVSYDANMDYWQEFNAKVIKELKKRIKPRDLILNIAGNPQKQISDAFPANITCEFGIGYGATFAQCRVFESYAWMHAVYGSEQGASHADGRFFDTVIPNYFDLKDFEFSDKKDDYFLFMSRPVYRKGVQIVKDLIEHAGIKVKVAGKEDPGFGEWVGYADPKKRSELMKHARAVLMPTLYLEPFGGVSVEAMLCGTPVISTDWGAFPEIIEQGKTGIRCHTLKEFIEATKKTDWDYKYISDQARSKYSLEAIKPMYETYFNRILTLHDNGWYEL